MSTNNGDRQDNDPTMEELHLDEDELDTILICFENEQPGRVTPFEIKELVRVYRSRLQLAAAAEPPSSGDGVTINISAQPIEGLVSTPHSPAVSAIAQERDVGEPVAWPVPVAYICDGCGRLTKDPNDDLHQLKFAGHLSCCPERDVQPLYLHPTTSPSAISEAPTSADAVTPNPPEPSP